MDFWKRGLKKEILTLGSRHIHQILACFLRLAAGAGVGTALFCGAADEPFFQAGFPAWGQTPRVCEYHWASVPLTLNNPTDQRQELVVSIRGEASPEALYSKHVAIGPRAVMQDSLLLVAERDTSYTATLSYADGRVLEVKSLISEHQNPFQAVPAYFVSDFPDLKGVSALAKNKDIGCRLITTRSSGENLPLYVPGYGAAALLVLISVDFEAMNAQQFTAIEEFVAAGGTLMVLGVSTLLEAAETPLEPLLPVTPLRSRRVSTLSALGSWGREDAPVAAPEWEEGTAMAEAVAKPGSLVVLQEGVHPLITWGQWGLGRVAACSFDPFVEGCRDSQIGTAIWRHLLSGLSAPSISGQAAHRPELQRCASRLVGFRVPGVDVVRNIMVAYFVLVSGLFILGFVVKRLVYSWLGAMACSLGLTVMILAAASRQLEGQAEKSAFVVDLACQTGFGPGTAVLGEKLVNLVARRDDRPDIAGTDPATMIRQPAPAPTHTSSPRRLPSMFSCVRENNLSRLQRLDVHENKASTFVATYRTLADCEGEPPVLSCGSEGLSLTPFTIPADIPASGTRAYLILAGGFRHVTVDGRECRLDGSRNRVELDTVAQDFERYLATTRLPSPSLVLLYRAPAPSGDIVYGGGSYAEQRHVLRLIPVTVVAAGDKAIGISAADVVVTPTGKGARALLWNNEWQETVHHGGDSSFLFLARLPLWYRQMELSGARIDLSLTSSADDVKARVELVPYRPGEPGDAGAVESIAAARVDGERFIFEGLDARRLVNPLDGSVLVKMTVSGRDDAGNQASAVTAGGKWRIRNFEISFAGTMR